MLFKILDWFILVKGSCIRIRTELYNKSHFKAYAPVIFSDTIQAFFVLPPFICWHIFIHENVSRCVIRWSRDLGILQTNFLPNLDLTGKILFSNISFSTSFRVSSRFKASLLVISWDELSILRSITSF